MERVTQDDWEALRADLARSPKRPAPKPKAVPRQSRTDWMPDSWKVIALLVLVLWPVALMHGSAQGWVAEGGYLVLLGLFAAGARYSGR